MIEPAPPTAPFNPDSTVEIDRRLSKDLDRRKNAEEIEQYRFKRRCAYYSMAFMIAMFLCSQISPVDLPPHWAQITDTMVYVCGAAIIGSIVPEAAAAIASTMRKT